MGPQGAVPEWGRQIGVSKWSDGQMLFNVLLEQMHGFPYNLKRGNMNMTSQLFPSPRKAHIKMVIFNFSDFERQKVIQ